MNRMGFLASPERVDKINKNKDARDCALVCDSGNSISFEDLLCHLLVMGTTGSGKTASVVLPALFRLIEAGHGGLVVDIKGNLREQVRAFARHCGREDDVVEFGSAPSATPLNLLYGMAINDVRAFLETLTMQHFQGDSRNKDFHMKGVHQLTDCVQLLRYLAPVNAAFEPTPALLAALANDYEQAAASFKLFTDTVYDEKNKGQRRFMQRIKSNEFHILRYDPKNAGRGSNYMEQLNYALQCPRISLDAFMDAPGIARGFAAQGAEGLDMLRLLRDKKIILLRFGPDTGPTGADLARVALQAYYKAVFTCGLSMPAGAYSFVCLDEFQEFADLGPARFSDAGFIAQAREFRAIFLASTQSMSALANRGNSPAATDAFASNFGTRVLFYSDDPRTQNMARQYDPEISLNALRSGEAFVVQYDTQSRNHSFGVETLHQAYAATRDILLQNAVPTAVDVSVIPENTGPETAEPDIFELLEQEAAKHAPAETTPAPGRYRRPAMSDLKERGGTFETSISAENERTDEPMGQASERPAELPEQETTNEEGAERLRRLFPQYFMNDGNVLMAVPAGWLEHAEKALRAFARSGLRLRISTMTEMDGALVVSVTTPDRRHGGMLPFRHTAERIMNSLLRGTKELCPLCGRHITRQGQDDSLEAPITVCDECLAKHGLLPGRKHNEAVENEGKPL